MTEAVKKELTEKELDALREIHISVDLRGLIKAWNKLFYEAPFDAYKKIALKVEGVSRKMMTGNASVLGMPMGIVLRNTSRAAYHSAKGDTFYSSRIIGGVAAAAAIVASSLFGAPYIAAAAIAAGAFVGAPLFAATAVAAVGSFLGTIGTFAAMGVASMLLLPVPVFTAATLLSSTIVAGAVAAFSGLVAAPVNLLVAWRRSKASLQGVKLTEDDMEKLQTEFDRQSPNVRYQQDMVWTVTNGLDALPPAEKQKIYLSLQAEFGAAAAPPVPAAPPSQASPEITYKP